MLFSNKFAVQKRFRNRIRPLCCQKMTNKEPSASESVSDSKNKVWKQKK